MLVVVLPLLVGQARGVLSAAAAMAAYRGCPHDRLRAAFDSSLIAAPLEQVARLPGRHRMPSV